MIKSNPKTAVWNMRSLYFALLFFTGTSFWACYNKDDLDRLSLRQTSEATFTIGNQLATKNLAFLSEKFRNTAPEVLAANALSSDEVSEISPTSATVNLSGITTELDSASQLLVGVVRGQYDYLVTGKLDTIPSGNTEGINLLMVNASLRDYFLATDSVQFFVILSLKDTTASSAGATLNFGYEFRN